MSIKYDVYIASCYEDGGIYHFLMDEDGRMSLQDSVRMSKPMYLAIYDEKMYALLRSPFEENSESGMVTFDIADDGRLLNCSEALTTFGEVACHIAIDDDGAYCANYLSGSAVKMPDKPVRHSGSGKNPKRQEMPHPHGCTITPDKKYVCITDLGTDTIYVYNKAMNLYSKANVPEGHGVRHMAFSEDGKYAFTVNELESTVSAFEYGEGELHLLDTVSALPEAFEGENLAAAIRVRNGDIYVSNRGADLIARLEFDGKHLTLCESVSCRGKSPRDFDFVGEFLISTNENSDNVTVFAVSEEYISDMIGEVEIKSPLCIVSVLHKEI